MDRARFAIVCLTLVVAGCGTLRASFNDELIVDAPPGAAPNLGRIPSTSAPIQAQVVLPAAPLQAALASDTSSDAPPRASFAVDGKRGNDRTLFFLALSGGGSRAAYLSAKAMLALERRYDDVDLLNEVDAISSVSGGSLAAAYYVASRDDELRLDGPLSPLAAWADPDANPVPSLQFEARPGQPPKLVGCKAPLTTADEMQLRQAFSVASVAADRVIAYCKQVGLPLRPWRDVEGHMTRNYLLGWFLRWFRPDNIVSYWFTAWDRSDIMAQTMENTLFSKPFLKGGTVTFGDLNPQRPYLLLNATNATREVQEDFKVGRDAAAATSDMDNFSFGSVFTFTTDDFRDRLHSDLQRYSLARGVMASSAFPLVFPSMTLRDFRPNASPACPGQDTPECRRYLHVFDGGNSDNLGLRSIKRALLQLKVDDKLDQDYDKIVVLLVDAFTKPRGTSRVDADPRSPIGFLLDTNVSDAVDSLLQTNRNRLLAEFQRGVLDTGEGECLPLGSSLPRSLCLRLIGQDGTTAPLDISKKLVFCHIGFHDVAATNPQLKEHLDRIPTSFTISDRDAGYIDEAVPAMLAGPCLERIHEGVRKAGGAQSARASAEDVR